MKKPAKTARKTARKTAQAKRKRLPRFVEDDRHRELQVSLMRKTNELRLAKDHHELERARARNELELVRTDLRAWDRFADRALVTLLTYGPSSERPRIAPDLSCKIADRMLEHRRKVRANLGLDPLTGLLGPEK